MCLFRMLRMRNMFLPTYLLVIARIKMHIYKIMLQLFQDRSFQDCFTT